MDNYAMYMTAEELIKTIEGLRLEKDWSLLRVAKESGVPYHWLVDLNRNKPQKPDMKRAQQVLAVLQRKEIKPIKMSETENALFEALQIVIGAQALPGNFTKTLEEKFSDQIEVFQESQQQDAAGVMEKLLEFLHSGLPKQAIPKPPQSLRRALDQPGEGKNSKNQP